MARHYLKGFMASATIKIVALALAFLLQLVLARVMGAEWYGQITYVLTWVGLIVVVAVAGTDAAAVRFVAELDAQGKRTVVLHFVSWASSRINRFLKLVLPAGVALGLFLNFSNPEFSLLAYLIVLGGIYFQARNLFFTSLVQGLRRPAWSQFFLGVALPLLLLVALAGFHFFETEARSEYVAVAYVCSMIVVYLWASGFVKKQSHEEPGRKPNLDNPAEWGMVAYRLLLMAVIGMLLSKFDILLLGWFVLPADVGIYNVSARLAEFVSLALVVSNLVVAPLIARHYQAGEMEQLQRLLTFSGRLVTVVALLMLAGLVFFGANVLGWYGAIFVKGYEVLLILAVGQLINALFGPVGYMLIMTGHAAVALRIYAWAVAMLIILALMLTPWLGMIGAAIASAVGVVTWNVAMCRYVVRHLGLDPTVLGMFRRRA